VQVLDSVWYHAFKLVGSRRWALSGLQNHQAGFNSSYSRQLSCLCREGRKGRPEDGADTVFMTGVT